MRRINLFAGVFENRLWLLILSLRPPGGTGAEGEAAYKALSNIDGDGGKSMSEQNRHSFTLAISPPPADGGDALAVSTPSVGSTAEGTHQSAGELLRLTLNVEAPGQDIIRISAVDGRGRSYEGRLSLRLVAREDICYVCDANGCKWVSPCPENSGGSV
jgi:hypothetical protein